MKFIFFLKGITALLLVPNILFAHQWVKTFSLNPSIGPEIYYMKRTKEGGAEQTGTLYGVRANYDHIRRYKFYWGAEALWAKGTLNGKVNENKLKSDFTDINIEARLGYTLQSKCWRCASFTPYLGLGYFWEKNFYKSPSPLEVHFENNFSYIPLGFLSEIFIYPTLSIGLNFKVRYIIKGKNHVSHDPDNDKLTQNYDNKLQYRVELPITFFFNWNCLPLGMSLVPFYEYRKYGHKINFPFDFLETQLKLYGATLKVLYRY